MRAQERLVHLRMLQRAGAVADRGQSPHEPEGNRRARRGAGLPEPPATNCLLRVARRLGGQRKAFQRVSEVRC